MYKRRTDAALKAAAKRARLIHEGRTHVDRERSRLAKLAVRKMSKNDRHLRAVKAAKTRKAFQHQINKKIAVTHRAKHHGKH